MPDVLRIFSVSVFLLSLPLFNSNIMKTIRFLLISLIAVTLFSSCTDNATYTFVDNYGWYGVDEYHVHFYEYDATGNVVSTNDLDFPAIGQNYYYTASDDATSLKVKVYIEYGTTVIDKWINKVWQLSPSMNTDIVFDEYTSLSSREP